jgi:NAD(P)H-hydrate epimerase
MGGVERVLMPFYSPEGIEIPSVTTEEMREVDRIAVEEFQLGILQMMENAGRNLAQIVMKKLEGRNDPVVILAGSGGNGGGGLSSARHLHNHGKKVSLVLSKSADDLGPAATNQLTILNQAQLFPLPEDEIEGALQEASIVVDALIGYSLQGLPRGKTAALIRLCNQFAQWVVSLDVPSGLDSTTGEAPGDVIRPNTTLTLALPKSGLEHIEGEIYLADIGIPPEVFEPLGIHFKPFFKDQYWIPLKRSMK